ncbi:hypothetical protein DENIS_0365 [Desulfonema ishimotonii]|uniref:Dehydrogenase n=1 Tax=Desulfonema ishimotonii TaxID=45657 RepID=A0A401FR36_9BACT|nr:XdhC/CoxI family protein [Desulfonema ishimotonii]GBC59426.1 hypothetical protein DENIS_0365 [Desulfonema ishimotonii]
MNKIEKHICQLIEKEEKFVLATILSQVGSTPRLPGTKMIIRSDGSIIGTIGGGLVEAEVMKAAPEVMETGSAQIRDFNLNVANPDDSMDMICGGHLEILMESVMPDQNTLRMFETFLEYSRKGQKSILASDISDVGKNNSIIQRCLFAEGGTLYGDTDFPADFLESLMQKTCKARSPSLLVVDDRRFLVEPSFSAGTAFLFGAGHVSQQLARLTHMVDFRTVILDDRAEFANAERFAEAEEVIVLADFEKALDGLDIGPDSYVVILTRGHSHDQTVLEQALGTEAGYIGMIGSHKKRDTIYQSLLQKGFTQEDLKRVHSPIGLSIKAETPEEIAVSIIGEMIAHRAGA